MSNIEAIIKPALDAYTKALGEHRHDFGSQPPACLCGRTFGSKRSVGMHVAAEHKRASKACDAESKRLLDEHREKERRLQGAQDAAAFIRSMFR